MQQLIKKRSLLAKARLSAWVIWGLGAAFFFSEYFARISPSVMVPDLMRDLGVDALTLGSLSAYFYFAYISMQLPVGMLVDRYGPHKLLTFTALVCAVGALLFATAGNIAMADLGRLLMGFGAAFAFVGSLKLASVWFPASRFGLLAGMTQALGMLGAAVGDAPMAILVEHAGWRHAMVLVAGVFVVLSLLIGLIVRDYPANYPHYRAKLLKEKSILASLWIVLANPQSWYNAVYVGLLYAPSAAFAELWGVSFLQHAYGVDSEIAASAVGFIFIGWAVGGPVSGWLSDKLGRRKPIMYASALCGLLTLGAIIYFPMPFALTYVLLFLYGMTNTGVAIAYAVASEINPRPVAGTSMAWANMASVIVGACLQPLIGWFLDLSAGTVHMFGAHIHALHDFRMALLILPICSLAAFFAAFFVKETYCKRLDTQSSV